MLPPRKFLNIHVEALECHFWCSNTTISVKKSLVNSCSFFRFLEHQSYVFCISFSFMRIGRKVSQHESKSGFFLSRLHIGQDLGFSSKIGMVGQSDR